MLTVPAGLKAHLDGAATTLATCWVLTRTDGVTLCFTDHDRSLSFEGWVFEPAQALEASETVSNAGFAVGGLDVAGALSSTLLQDEDLDAGRFDGAQVEIWLVDWTQPTDRMRIRRAEIGEVTRIDGQFRAELRGLAHRLDVPGGRLFRQRCDAELGDTRCGVALDLPGRRVDAAITAVRDRATVSIATPAGFSAGAFQNGQLEVSSGAAAGLTMRVIGHRREAGSDRIALWQPLARAPAVGDAIRLTVGCDKRFATCTDVFANGVRFRGFPHMPSADFQVEAPGRRVGRNDGGRRT